MRYAATSISEKNSGKHASRSTKSCTVSECLTPFWKVTRHQRNSIRKCGTKFTENTLRNTVKKLTILQMNEDFRTTIRILGVILLIGAADSFFETPRIPRPVRRQQPVPFSPLPPRAKDEEELSSDNRVARLQLHGYSADEIDASFGNPGFTESTIPRRAKRYKPRRNTLLDLPMGER